MIGLGLGLRPPVAEAFTTLLRSAGATERSRPRSRPERPAARHVAVDRPPESFRPDRPGGDERFRQRQTVSRSNRASCSNAGRPATTGEGPARPASCDSHRRVAARVSPPHPTTESDHACSKDPPIVDVEGRAVPALAATISRPAAGTCHWRGKRIPKREALLHVDISDVCAVARVRRVLLSRAVDAGRFARPPQRRAGSGRTDSTPPIDSTPARATFIDFFNETLMPGIEMSGGYGLFRARRTAAAHIHDFDESICIVVATIKLGNEPQRVAAGAGKVWVTVQEPAKGTSGS